MKIIRLSLARLLNLMAASLLTKDEQHLHERMMFVNDSLKNHITFERERSPK